MQAQFKASQSVELVVEEQPIPIQHYLRQPQRLVKALADPTRIEQLSAEVFRLKMRPLNFMMLKVQPTVDMQLQSKADGTICLKSVGCEIRGVEYINQRFHLNLNGRLVPYQKEGKIYLTGRADLQVQVDLPPPLWFTPKALLEATGNGLLRSVLMTIKQRLMHQLVQDYHHWVAAQLEMEPGSSSQLLSANSSAS